MRIGRGDTELPGEIARKDFAGTASRTVSLSRQARTNFERSVKVRIGIESRKWKIEN